MSQLKRWLHIAGGFFVLLALASLPSIRANTFASTFPDPLDKRVTMAVGLPLDTEVMFGLELGVIGLMLIAVWRAPRQALKLVYPIIALEAARYILEDIGTIWRDNSAELYIIFIVIHLLMLVMGIAFLQQRLRGLSV